MPLKFASSSPPSAKQTPPSRPAMAVSRSRTPEEGAPAFLVVLPDGSLRIWDVGQLTAAEVHRQYPGHQLRCCAAPCPHPRLAPSAALAPGSAYYLSEERLPAATCQSGTTTCQTSPHSATTQGRSALTSPSSSPSAPAAPTSLSPSPSALSAPATLSPHTTNKTPNPFSRPSLRHCRSLSFNSLSGARLSSQLQVLDPEDVEGSYDDEEGDFDPADISEESLSESLALWRQRRQQPNEEVLEAKEVGIDVSIEILAMPEEEEEEQGRPQRSNSAETEGLPPMLGGCYASAEGQQHWDGRPPVRSSSLQRPPVDPTSLGFVNHAELPPMSHSAHLATAGYSAIPWSSNIALKPAGFAAGSSNWPVPPCNLYAQGFSPDTWYSSGGKRGQQHGTAHQASHYHAQQQHHISSAVTDHLLWNSASRGWPTSTSLDSQWVDSSSTALAMLDDAQCHQHQSRPTGNKSGKKGEKESGAASRVESKMSLARLLRKARRSGGEKLERSATKPQRPAMNVNFDFAS